MKKLLLFIILSFIFVGCRINGIPKMENYAKGWLWSDIQEYVNAEKHKSGSYYVQGWRDARKMKDYYLPNGNLIHIAPERKDCLIHWEVDKNTNKIIGYKFEGDRCY
jgi:hypothetical protein